MVRVWSRVISENNQSLTRVQLRKGIVNLYNNFPKSEDFEIQFNESSTNQASGKYNSQLVIEDGQTRMLFKSLDAGEEFKRRAATCLLKCPRS